MAVAFNRRPFTVGEYHAMLGAGILGEDRALGERGVVTVQNPVTLDDLSEPEPDLAVLRPRPDDYAGAHPRPATSFS